MLIPIDERMATRAHAVFDVVYVKKLKIINLDSHVDRIIKSSESVSIKPPVSSD
jgi:branched-subunit amino acid aminotransferase/4-amino-4-deoxychorismate lyase